MARGINNRQKRIDVGREARRRARMSGQPPAAKVIPDKRRKPAKHRKRELEEQFT
jgi:hypothetical protein